MGMPSFMFRSATFLKTAIILASLVTLSSCDDKPDTTPSREVVINNQTIDIAPDVFASILSLFEQAEPREKTSCHDLAASLSAALNKASTSGGFDLDPTKFAIKLENEDDFTSEVFDFAFDAVNNNCNLSIQSTTKSS